MGKSVAEFEGYKIYLSKSDEWKYYAIVKGERVHFGKRKSGQFKDILGYFAHRNHGKALHREIFKFRKRHQIAIWGSRRWFEWYLLWSSNIDPEFPELIQL